MSKTQSLCWSGGCCPQAEIREDGSLVLKEGTFQLELSKESTTILTAFLLQESEEEVKITPGES